MPAGIIHAITSGWTPGGVGIYILIAVVVVGFWKGLPPVLDAWSNSLDKERSSREREIERLERQIASSDKRHEECQEGQAELRKEIGRLQGVISGLVLQMRQLQLSNASIKDVDVGTLPPSIQTMVEALNRLPDQGR